MVLWRMEGEEITGSMPQVVYRCCFTVSWGNIMLLRLHGISWSCGLQLGAAECQITPLFFCNEVPL